MGTVTMTSSDRDRALVLLTREVLCEAIYRRRGDWNADHPNRALRLRDIDLSVVIQHVGEQHVLMMEKESLRAFAASLLDEVER